MSKKKNIDDRKQLLIRYKIDKIGNVSFIDPCCDEIPVQLFDKVMKAVSTVEREWNSCVTKIRKGQKFLCKETIVMDDLCIAYKKGSIYVSENDFCITDMQGDMEHEWPDYHGNNGWGYYFELVN